MSQDASPTAVCGSGSNVYLVLGGVSCGAVSGGAMPVNQWVYLAAVRAGSTWTLYVNGAAAGTSTLNPITPSGSTTVSPAGYRFNGRVDEVALYARALTAAQVADHYARATTVASSTSRYLLGGAIEADAAGTITAFPVSGPEGDLARYGTWPRPTANPRYLYYSGHGDLAAEANSLGKRTALYSYDPFGATSQTTLPGNSTAERFTGRWNKQLDTASGLIEMGARPYDPQLGRFLSVDPIEGGALNNYDYAAQDPLNSYDLDGTMVFPRGLCACGGFWRPFSVRASPRMSARTTPTPKGIESYRKQLEQHGIRSLMRSARSTIAQLERHLRLLYQETDPHNRSGIINNAVGHLKNLRAIMKVAHEWKFRKTG